MEKVKKQGCDLLQVHYEEVLQGQVKKQLKYGETICQGPEG